MPTLIGSVLKNKLYWDGQNRFRVVTPDKPDQRFIVPMVYADTMEAYWREYIHGRLHEFQLVALLFDLFREAD